jgi:hypothetical protein
MYNKGNTVYNIGGSLFCGAVPRGYKELHLKLGKDYCL